MVGGGGARGFPRRLVFLGVSFVDLLVVLGPLTLFLLEFGPLTHKQGLQAHPIRKDATKRDETFFRVRQHQPT